MTAINRKLFRDLWHLRGQVTAIGLVVTCGVVTVVTSRIGYESLESSQAAYYAEYHFTDVFASLKRAPESVIAKIREIPGVEAVQTRIVFDATLDVPGLDEPATGRFTSVPERHPPELNRLHIRRGRYLSPGRRNEVLVSEGFALANDLEPGSRFAAVLNGRWTELQVVGIALSPEYIYAIPVGALFPDNRRFGVIWMSREAMGPAFDLDGAFNDVVLSLSATANEAEVIARLDRLLEPYGGRNAYGREDHVSHRFISDEIRQNREFAVIMPMLFLGIAAFLLNVLLSRLIATQRDQIGVLKAFGYPHWRVALHYLEFALVGVLAGAVLGTGLGFWLGGLINQIYVEMYSFPVLRYELSPQAIAFTASACGIAALLGAFGAMRRTWSLPPAEAMRPEPPAGFRTGLIERFGLIARISPSTRIVLRNLARRPLRAALSTLGIAGAVALLVMGRFFIDAINHLSYVQFRLVQKEDVTVSSLEPLPASARHAFAQLPGVLRSETLRSVPVELSYGHITRKTILTGLERDADLRRLIGSNLTATPLPPEGLVLTSKLGEILGVEPGDTVTVEVLEGNREVRRAVVTGLVDELIGLSAYMNADALHRLLRESDAVSAAVIKLDPMLADEFFRELKTLPVVAGVGLRDAMIRSFEETLAKSMMVFTMVLVVFAVILSFAVVYNTARIALSERGRELASLRVLGFTRAEVTGMLLGEQALLTLLAIPVGYGLGYEICALLASRFQWELFRMPLVISVDTFLFAFVVIVTAALASGVAVQQRLHNLDLIEVLKTRE